LFLADDGDFIDTNKSIKKIEQFAPAILAEWNIK
jgi:hypothetical protein